MKIEKIVYEKNEEDNIFNNCIVYYEDGTTEITNDVVGKIMDFMDQEGLNFENVMKDSRIVSGKIETAKRENKVSSETLDNSERHDETRVSSEDNHIDSHKDKKKLGIKIISIASAVILGGVVIDYFLNKLEEKITKLKSIIN